MSHYRREHAPNRLYLPSDISEKTMYDLYQQSHEPKLQVSYPFYCRIIKRLNISLVKLGHEQCEKCVIGNQHKKDFHHDVDPLPGEAACKICDDLDAHLQLATRSRNSYREDGDEVLKGCIVLAVDLQKVYLKNNSERFNFINYYYLT